MNKIKKKQKKIVDMFYLKKEKKGYSIKLPK